jgi:putative membrane protein
MNTAPIINSIVYSILGVAIFCVGFIVIDKLTPYHLWRELTEHKNVALAIVVGFGILGICTIIAAAIH